MENILFTGQWPYVPVLEHLGLALALGLFVGLERERRHKEAGLRTFAFAALIGALGGLLGESYALLCIGLLGVLVVFLNVQSLRSDQGAELTTSAALLLTGLAGVLTGQGHTLTPAAVAVIVTALLTWKEPLAGFSVELSETELRSAVLLAIFAFVIFPALPEGTVGPWALVDPRDAWITVILIAAIGFVNYILFKAYGDRGVELTGFLGGLVNSTVTVGELAERVRETGGLLVESTYHGILLATVAMISRNAVLLVIIAPAALPHAALPFIFMGVVCGGLVLRRGKSRHEGKVPALPLKSPFSLLSVLRYGLLFLAIQIIGVIAQRSIGQAGVYAASFLGGLFSSASAVAAAGSLAARGLIAKNVAANSAILAAFASALSNFPLVLRSGDAKLVKRLGRDLGFTIVAGLIGIGIQAYLMSRIPHLP